MVDLAALIADQDEDKLLNNIWIGLLGVEALMVLGVALRGLVEAVSSSRLFGPRRRSSSSSSVFCADEHGLPSMRELPMGVEEFVRLN